MTKKYTVEKKLVAQVKYYEELFVIRDERGEAIYTGSRETAARILKLMQSQNKRKASK